MPPPHRHLLWIGPLLVGTPAADAGAAGVDEPAVGGVYGTAAATNPTAVWWNPAGLAAARGTRFLADVGPSFSRLTVDRRGLNARPGLERFTAAAAVPFVGLASDFGVRRIGVGFALFAPYGQRWTSDTGGGPNRYAVRTTRLRTLQLALAGAYEFGRRLSIGVSAAMVDSRVDWTFDRPFVTELAADAPGAFDDAQLTDPAYAATTTLGVEDQATSFGVGLYLKPFGDPRLAIAVAYQHGLVLDHEGTAQLAFACPPKDDPVGRELATARGLCDATVSGLGTLRLRLPSRVHAGVKVRPSESLRLEAFGTWVGWSRLDDVRIGTAFTADAFDGTDPEVTAGRFTRERPQARDLRDTFSATLDAKYRVTPQFTIGLRAGFESAATPTSTLAVFDVDAPTVRVAGLGLFRPLRGLEVGVSYGQDLALTREVTDSAFAVSLEPDRPVRFRYPEARGRYASSAQRVGFVVKSSLGPPRPRERSARR